MYRYTLYEFTVHMTSINLLNALLMGLSIALPFLSYFDS